MTYRSVSDGKKISLLGYGAMRMPTDSASNSGIDQKELNAQVKWMLEHGINYFDTSPAYCKGKSEECLGEALAKSGFSREQYVLATKMSNFAPHQFPLEKCKEMFESSLVRLRTDYIDNYLLHSIGNGGFATFSKRYLENGALDWLVTLREQRRIRNLGFSFHGDPKTFEWCMANHGRYHWDFCMIQMNYVDWRHGSRSTGRNLDAEYLYNELTSRKIPVIVMEPLLGGRLARYNYAIARELIPLDPQASLASWSLRFCATYPNVVTILSGMSRLEHMRENVATFSPFKPCKAEEMAALERAANAMLKLTPIPCNDCKYCMPCPYGLDIPALLTFRNSVLSEENPPSAREVLRRYAAAIPDALRRAEHCIGCGKCNSHCPQQINIPREIESIDEWISALEDEVLK